jgi:hypothetical protein
MTDTDNDSWLGSLGARYRYAQYDPEQVFERSHTTARSAAANLLYTPSRFFEKRSLYKDRPDANENVLAAISIRLASEVGAKNWMARYLRSLTSGYDTFQQFKETGKSCEELEALAAAASNYSSQGDVQQGSMADELGRVYLSPMHSLIIHSDEAGKMFSDLCKGQLAITPETTEKLETHLNALADLCHERTEMLRHINRHTLDADGNEIKGHKPADYIRDVITAKEITSPRQLEILFSFIPALIADGAVQLSTEIFIPKDKTFLTPEQAVMLSHGVQNMVQQYGLVAKDGVMQRRDRDSGEQRPLSLKEINEIGTTLLRQVQGVAGRQVQTLLDFADEHYQEIEQKLMDARHPEHKQPPKALQFSGNMLETAPWQDKVRGGQYSPNDTSLAAMGKHIWRPESRHEIGKLFSRSLPMYLLALPVTLVTNMLLGFTKTNPLTGKVQYITKENLHSSLINLATHPIIESAGVVSLKEALTFPQSLMLDRADTMEKVLYAAIHTSSKLSPELAQSVEASNHSERVLERLQAHPFYQKVQDICKKSDAVKTVEDYETLETYFKEMGKVVHDLADQVMKPYRKSDNESLSDITRRVLEQGATSAGEAALALSFVKAAIRINKAHVGMLEFEDTSGILMEKAQLKTLTDFIDRQTYAAQIRLSDDNELQQLNEKTGQYEVIGEQSLIRFANVVSGKLTDLVSVEKITSAAVGKLKEDYQVELAKDLFGAEKKTRLSLVSGKDTQPLPQVDASLTRPWAEITAGSGIGNAIRGVLDAPQHLKGAYEYSRRPEAANEAKLLLGRMFFTRMLAFPSEILENITMGHTKVDKETGKKQWVTPENLKSSVWKLLSFPLVYSYGIVTAREMFMYPQKLTIDDANTAGNTLLAAIHTGVDLAPSLKHNIAHMSRSNPALVELEARPELQSVAYITSKPPELRTAQDDLLMQQFFKQAGDAVLDHSAQLFAASHGEQDNDMPMGEHMQRVLRSPVSNVNDAVMALAFTQSLLHFNTKHIGVLRYLDPKEVVINTKGVGELASFIRLQAGAAGFTVQDGKLCHTGEGKDVAPLSDHELIRFANVVTAQLRKEVNVDKLAELAEGVAADQYLAHAQKQIFQSNLPAPHER